MQSAKTASATMSQLQLLKLEAVLSKGKQQKSRGEARLAYNTGSPFCAQALVRQKRSSAAPRGPPSAGNASSSVGYPDTMDIGNMLASLRQERDQITEAIMSLERMAIGHREERGRPPAWMVAARQTPTKRRGRPPGSKNVAKNS